MNITQIESQITYNVALLSFSYKMIPLFSENMTKKNYSLERFIKQKLVWKYLIHIKYIVNQGSNKIARLLHLDYELYSSLPATIRNLLPTHKTWKQITREITKVSFISFPYFTVSLTISSNSFCCFPIEIRTHTSR